MEILIDGKQLHVFPNTVTVDFTNIRFSDAIPDEWSSEITIANDEWNISLLGMYGLLDRGALFTEYVKCGVMVDGIERDGYIQILDINENEVHIRVFLTVIPYAVIDKDLSEYFSADNENSIWRWDRYTARTNNIAGISCGMIKYNYTKDDYYSNILAQWHPSVKVSSILANIQTAEGLDLPSVDENWFQLSSKKVVCPYNEIQCIMGRYQHGNAESGTTIPFCGGQHITNDLKSDWSYADFKWESDWSDWKKKETVYEWVKDESTKTVMTFNRACNAHIKLYATATKVGGYIEPQCNGQNITHTILSTIPVIPNGTDEQNPWNPEDYVMWEGDYGFDDGDEFTLHYSGSAQSGGREVFYTLIITYDSYDVTSDDFDTELTYLPAPFGVLGKRDTSNFVGMLTFHDYTAGTGFGHSDYLDYSFCYIGAWSSLDGSMSVRDYITSLCWSKNMKTHLDRNTLSFHSANQYADVSANITQITPANEKLGKHNIIKYRDCDNELTFDIDNDFLENEVTLHESVFTTGDNLPQYSYDNTYREGTPWVEDIKVNFEDLGAVLMTAVSDGGSYVLQKAPDLVGFGLVDLNSAMTITAKAIGRYSDLDYVFINGHKYMMVQGNYEYQTDITEFTAIQCYTSGTEYEPSLDVFITGSDRLTSSSVRLQIRINES